MPQKHPPANTARSSLIAHLHLIQILAVAFSGHRLARNETQRRRIDAVAQPAAIRRPVVEDMAEMAVAMRRAHLGADHAVRAVPPLVHVGRLDRLGETRPAAGRIELVRGGKQRLARDHVHVNPRRAVAQILARARPLGGRLLRHPVLLRRQLRHRRRILPIFRHLPPASRALSKLPLSKLLFYPSAHHRRRRPIGSVQVCSCKMETDFYNTSCNRWNNLQHNVSEFVTALKSIQPELGSSDARAAMPVWRNISTKFITVSDTSPRTCARI